MVIMLHDFGEKDRHFVLDDPAGKWTVEKGSSPLSWGVASLIPQRCGFSKPVLVAVFTDRKTILLRIGDKLFDLGDARVILRNRWAGILYKKFTVLKNDEEVASVGYGELGVDRDPFNEDSFFDYLMAMFSDRSHLDRSVFVWTASSEGRKPDEAMVAEMEARFNSHNASKPQTSIIKGMLCLASYWLLFVILPAGLVLSLVPKGWRIGVGVPVGFLLLIIGENGFRRWKKLWLVE